MIGLEPTISNEDFLTMVKEISSTDSVKELVKTIEKYMTYETVIYHHIAAIGAYDYSKLNRFWSNGLKPEVLKYLEMKSDTQEPVMRHVFTNAKPCWLSDLETDEAFFQGRNRWRVELALANIGDCILLPLYGPFDRLGYIALRFQKPREFFDPIFLWQIFGIMQAIHIRYCVLNEALRSAVKLTKREAEVLELITFGKTNPEIGTILGISTSTVSGYVKQIFLKFDASDRVTVALRARRSNL